LGCPFRFSIKKFFFYNQRVTPARFYIYIRIDINIYFYIYINGTILHNCEKPVLTCTKTCNIRPLAGDSGRRRIYGK